MLKVRDQPNDNEDILPRNGPGDPGKDPEDGGLIEIRSAKPRAASADHPRSNGGARSDQPRPSPPNLIAHLANDDKFLVSPLRGLHNCLENFDSEIEPVDDENNAKQYGSRPMRPNGTEQNGRSQERMREEAKRAARVPR